MKKFFNSLLASLPFILLAILLITLLCFLSELAIIDYNSEDPNNPLTNITAIILGLSRARGRGLRSILFQAKLTAIAVNLKRIAAITGKKTLPVIAVFKKIEDYFQKFILNTNFASVFLPADC